MQKSWIVQFRLPPASAKWYHYTDELSPRRVTRDFPKDKEK
jgi:hypothetical protein